MKRHPTFVPLSRDHHDALVLARGIQTNASFTLKGTLPKDVAGRAAHVVRAFGEELDPHFRCEEQVLLPALRGRDPELDRACDEVVADHAALRALVAQLAERPNEEALDAFGKRLETHVRSEERSLFEIAQRVVPEAELTALTGSVESFSARARAR